MKKILYYISSIVLLSVLGGCKKADKPAQPEQPATVSKPVKQSTEIDSLLDFEFNDDFFRSINTVDAHDERDTIYGNFTGRRRDMLYVLTVPTDSVSFYIDTTRVQNWQRYELDEHVRYFLVSNNPRIPYLELWGCDGIQPKLVFEGDLDRNGRDEVGYLHTWLNSQWRDYRVFTMVGREWRYLTCNDKLSTPEWFRHSGVDIVERGPRKGTVKINYGTYDPQYDENNYYIGGLDQKDTIIVPDFPVIED